MRPLLRIWRGLVDPGPLDHPDLAAMTPRELDDLPLPRWTAAPPAAPRTQGACG